MLIQLIITFGFLTAAMFAVQVSTPVRKGEPI